MSDKELLKGLINGKPEAFKKLVEEYQNRVITTCYKFLQNKEDAEDTAQEIFIEVYKSVDSFREESKLSTWIYRISVTKSLDFIRKRKRKKRIGKIRKTLGLETRTEQISAPSSSDPGISLEIQERLRVLQQAIESLAQNQKIAIMLSKCEELSNKEIAEIMGTTVSSVESLIHRAKNNLRKKLYDYYEK